MKNRLIFCAILALALSSCRHIVDDDDYPHSTWSISEVRIINLDGSNEIYLTYDNQFVHFANFLPNGERIILVQGSTIKSEQSVYSMKPDGTGKTFLFSKLIFLNGSATDQGIPKRMFLTSDSKQIIFSTYTGWGTRDIYSVNVDGTNMVNITNNASLMVYIGSFNISSDGKMVVYSEIHKDSTNTNYICTQNTDGTNKKIIKSITSSEPFYPQFLPTDNTQIVYFEQTPSSEYALKKVSTADTSVTSSITTVPFLVEYPQIIAGNKLIYKVFGHTNSELYTIDVSTGAQQLIFSSLSIYDVSSNADGTMLAWTSNNKNFGVIRSNGQIVQSLTADSSERAIYSPFVSPSNQQIIFRSITSFGTDL